MSINSVDALTSTQYTKNGNAYQSCNTGKKVGAAVGAGVVAARTVSLLKDKEMRAYLNLSWKNIASDPVSKLSKAVAKYPKLYKAGLVGIGASIALLLYAGIGKLIGHGVDKIVENKRAKEADAQAEQKAREIELTNKLDILL